MFIPAKTMEQLQSRSLDLLKNTPIKDSGPGQVVRLLLAAINSNLADYYDNLSTQHFASYVSTAEGDMLDLLGDIVHCKRLSGESDSEYRYRISQQALADATANNMAIRLAALSVDGVKDVILHEYALGVGSCAVYCVIDDIKQEENILAAVRKNIEKTKGSGSRVEVLTPKLIPVGIKLALVFKSGINDMDKQTIRGTAAMAIAAYLNSVYPGQPVLMKSIDEIARQSGLYSADDIAEVHILNLTRDGKGVKVENQSCRWNERFVEDGIAGVRVV